MRIGARLREFRISEGFSQQFVADYLGCERQTYTRYENDQRLPDLDTLCKLADLFETSTDYILGRNNY